MKCVQTLGDCMEPLVQNHRGQRAPALPLVVFSKDVWCIYISSWPILLFACYSQSPLTL